MDASTPGGRHPARGLDPTRLKYIEVELKPGDHLRVGDVDISIATRLDRRGHNETNLAINAPPEVLIIRDEATEELKSQWRRRHEQRRNTQAGY